MASEVDRTTRGTDAFSGIDLVQTLLRNDLVDRLNLWVLPVLLGSGKRLFAEGTVPTALRLVGTRAARRPLPVENQHKHRIGESAWTCRGVAGGLLLAWW